MTARMAGLCGDMNTTLRRAQVASFAILNAMRTWQSLHHNLIAIKQQNNLTVMYFYETAYHSDLYPCTGSIRVSG